MNKHDFHKAFRSVGPAVLPVIHVLDEAQARRNVARAIACGAHGVFLINHDFPVEPFLPIIRDVRQAWPSLWLGVNFLAVPLAEALPTINQLQRDGVVIDGYWADDARIDENRATHDQPEAKLADQRRRDYQWNGLYFGGTAFKKQRVVDPGDYATAASIASHWMDVVTTSGVATGNAAEIGKIEMFRHACAESAIAVASGITPDNAELYAPFVDAFLVATGINQADDFYNIDASRLRTLIQTCCDYGAKNG